MSSESSVAFDPKFSRCGVDATFTTNDLDHPFAYYQSAQLAPIEFIVSP